MLLFMVWLHTGPRFILNADDSVRQEGLDNHGMGTVFEGLMWGFNEEAGEHFTPRDVVHSWEPRLHAGADEVRSGMYLIYDGACGARGMLTVAATTGLPGCFPRFFGLARLEERERIDYDLPLHGQPFFDFAWEDGPRRWRWASRSCLARSMSRLIISVVAVALLVYP